MQRLSVSMDSIKPRSVLYVPGDSPRKLAKAAGVPADGFIIDWEDAVAEDRKDAARNATVRAMPTLLDLGRYVFVRRNPTPGVFADADADALRECAPDGVVIPKCEGLEDVEQALDGLPGSVLVFAMIESPQGLHNAHAIAAFSARVAGLMFGAEDYSACTGIIRSEGEPELAYARSQVVNAARAAGREVFDSPSMQYRDLAVVREAAVRARRLGFTGQAAIHPGQVEVINESFLPSDREIGEARAVLRRYEAHGGGVAGFEGALEDKPAVLEALGRINARRRFEK